MSGVTGVWVCRECCRSSAAYASTRCLNPCQVRVLDATKGLEASNSHESSNLYVHVKGACVTGRGYVGFGVRCNGGLFH